MKLDEIHDMWGEDCDIDRTELGNESLKLPKMHSNIFVYFLMRICC
jgi:hypothetical protein